MGEGTDRTPRETEVRPQKELPETPVSSARYVNLRYHASGGLGDVYRASDESLRREVALKFIQSRHCGDLEHLDLFLTEAEITSRLDHPGVVPVYGIGECESGRPFYAMRFIEGVPMRAAIESCHQEPGCHWRLHQLITHLVVVCKTVAYAHNRGIIHRDIKPDNIMIGRFGETLLVDWGLAAAVQRDERARASGENTIQLRSGSDSGKSSGKSSGSGVGTIGYMSPEQLPDHPGPLTTASDIYSLALHSTAS